MKYFRNILFILLVAAATQACNHSAKAGNNDADNDNATSDTIVSPAEAAPDTTSPKINLVVDQQDSLFAAKAAAFDRHGEQKLNLFYKPSDRKMGRANGSRDCAPDDRLREPHPANLAGMSAGATGKERKNDQCSNIFREV